jgi:ABC-type spermidine/putrescine transport system permease subunit II
MNSRGYGRWLMPAATLVILFLYAPLIVVMVYAFNSGRNLTWPPQGLSVRWFQHIFADPNFRSALGLSFLTASLAALLAGVIGTMSAIVFMRSRGWSVRTSELLGRLPVVIPPLLIGIGLVALMKVTGVQPGPVTIVIGQAVLSLPFVIIVVSAALRNYDLDLESAARDLGASPGQVVVRITLPLIAPAILGATMLAFAISFDEVLLTNFTSGASTTVPLYIFGLIRRYIDPSANAVAAILMVVPWLAIVVGGMLFRRSGAASSMLNGGR